MKPQKTSTQTQQTVKEIKEALREGQSPSQEYIEGLKLDSRKGVRQALKQYEKIQLKQAQVKEQYQKMQAYENNYRAKGFRSIAGIDEVGRGPLAGPVVSAAVILPEAPSLEGINDSKQLSERERNAWAEKILAVALAVNVSVISPQVIDDVNIYEATKISMKEAVAGLSVQPDCLLIDAMRLDLPITQEKIIKGDAKSISIAAASIIAKVTRDQMMTELALTYPGYGFEKNAGYGTKEHLDGLAELGVTPIHRRSFKPVKELL